MTTLELARSQLQAAPTGIYGQVRVTLGAWRRVRTLARLRAERKSVRGQLRESFNTLCDAKCRLLKSTGVYGTDHTNLEAALVHLARALDDYNDGA